MKTQMIEEVSKNLTSLGIPVKNGIDTDIVITTEFLNAGWSTGSKKINYEALIFANEQDNVVYMYEKTTETGHGLSFGGDSEISSQSGTAVYRKVKSVQYGLDGKAYEYTLDLGGIIKTVKETAGKYGWKFKIVLNKNKASYPAGYMPQFVPPLGQPQPSEELPRAENGFCTNCGAPLKKDTKFCEKCGKPVVVIPQQPPVIPPEMPSGPQYKQHSEPQLSEPQTAFSAQTKAPLQNRNTGKLGLIAFIVLGIVAVLIFALMKVSIVGWIIGIVTLSGFGLLQRRFLHRGCFISIVLWVITCVILIIILIFATPNKNISTSTTASSVDFSTKLPYEKSFTLSDGKSIGKFKLFVSDGTGRYPNYKGKVICEFYVKFDTSSLPKDFKLTEKQATAKNASGGPALDGLVMVVCSDTAAYHNTGLSYAQYIYNNGNIRPFLETEGGTTNVNAASIKELAAKYPKMLVLRYNETEVDMTKVGDSWTTNTKKAFGLHPPVTEGKIPWNEILSDLNIK